MTGAIWDTVWSVDPALGTIGDWSLAGYNPPAVVDPFAGEVTALDAYNSGGLQNVDPVGTAVLLCLASDARLPDYLVGRFGFTIADQKEWHGNTVAVDTASGEEPLGSLLWTLRRAPLTNYTAKMAEHFAAQALQTLIHQRVVSQFSIHAEIDKVLGRLSLYVSAYVPGQGEREWVHDLYAIQ